MATFYFLDITTQRISILYKQSISHTYVLTAQRHRDKYLPTGCAGGGLPIVSVWLCISMYQKCLEWVHFT